MGRISRVVRLAATVAGQVPGGGGTPADTGFVIAGAGANVSGGNDVWQNTGNITADDATEAAAGGLALGETTQYLYASSFNFSAIPDGATIDGITVRIQRRRQASGDTMIDNTIQLTKDGAARIGDNKADVATNWPTTATNKDYGGTSDLWGTTWSAAEVKASTFGVHVKAECTVASSGSNVRVDAIWIQVNYTA